MIVGNFIALERWMDQVGVDVFTGDLHAHHLASGDQMTVFAIVVDEGGAPGKITVTFEHSQDGVNYAPKNMAPEINAQTLTASNKTVLCGYDSGQLPSGAHARYRVHCTGTAPLRVWVRLFVTVRDLDLDWIPQVEHHKVPERPAPRPSDTPREDALDERRNPHGGSRPGRPDGGK